MSIKLPGGKLTAVTQVTSGTAYTGAAGGIWTLTQQARAVASNAWPISISAPSAPAIIDTIAGNNQAYVYFTAPSNIGGLAISSYTVVSSPGGISASGTTSPITVTGLNNGTSYTFTISATNGSGVGSSSSASTIAAPSLAPWIPTNVVATAGTSQASVSFTAPVSNGNAAVTGYTVTSNPGSITASGTVSPVVITGLSNGTAYTFTVTANNASGSGPASASSNEVTPGGVPSAPTISTVTKGDTQVSVAFTTPNNNGYAITGYTVTSSPGNITATGASSPINVTGLTNGTAYTFTVKATNSLGTGASSAASASVTPNPPVPVAPSGITISSITNNSFVLSWTPDANVASYTLYNSGGTQVTQTITNGMTVLYQYGTTVMAPFTTYTFYLRATNVAGSTNSSTFNAATSRKLFNVAWGGSGILSSSVKVLDDAWFRSAIGGSYDGSVCDFTLTISGDTGTTPANANLDSPALNIFPQFPSNSILRVVFDSTARIFGGNASGQSGGSGGAGSDGKTSRLCGLGLNLSCPTTVTNYGLIAGGGGSGGNGGAGASSPYNSNGGAGGSGAPAIASINTSYSLTFYNYGTIAGGGGAGGDPVAGGAAWANVKLLLNGDGTNGWTTFTDLSSAANTLTRSGNTRISTAQKKFGTGSIMFDGTGDYLTMPTTTNLIFDADFTIECWVYRVTASADYDAIYSATTNGEWSSTGVDVALVWSCGGFHGFGLPWTLYSSGTSVPTGVWTHMAVTKASGAVSFYIGGTRVHSLSHSGNIGITGQRQGIGVFDFADSSGRLFFNGYIDDFRITKGTALYTGNSYTPPTAALPTS